MLKQGTRVVHTLWPDWHGVVTRDQKYEQLVSVQWDWSSHGPSVEFTHDRDNVALLQPEKTDEHTKQ